MKAITIYLPKWKDQTAVSLGSEIHTSDDSTKLGKATNAVNSCVKGTLDVLAVGKFSGNVVDPTVDVERSENRQ